MKKASADELLSIEGSQSKDAIEADLFFSKKPPYVHIDHPVIDLLMQELSSHGCAMVLGQHFIRGEFHIKTDLSEIYEYGLALTHLHYVCIRQHRFCYDPDFMEEALKARHMMKGHTFKRVANMYKNLVKVIRQAHLVRKPIEIYRKWERETFEPYFDEIVPHIAEKHPESHINSGVQSHVAKWKSLAAIAIYRAKSKPVRVYLNKIWEAELLRDIVKAIQKQLSSPNSIDFLVLERSDSRFLNARFKILK